MKYSTFWLLVKENLVKLVHYDNLVLQNIFAVMVVSTVKFIKLHLDLLHPLLFCANVLFKFNISPPGCWRRIYR